MYIFTNVIVVHKIKEIKNNNKISIAQILKNVEQRSFKETYMSPLLKMIYLQNKNLRAYRIISYCLILYMYIETCIQLTVTEP